MKDNLLMKVFTICAGFIAYSIVLVTGFYPLAIYIKEGCSCVLWGLIFTIPLGVVEGIFFYLLLKLTWR